ncbi:hypothetical protein [Falsiroseomonas sp. HW251]|uniref:hypothetical protein n=1 Tax=Falsiroseomonas sp. HW251 TaxID=3390998 RepID=UPI003D322E24
MSAARRSETRRLAELEGLVDNANEHRLYGWAWNSADPAEPLTIELRLAGEVVVSAAADRMREDLAKAGIGDGRHAFELPLRPEWAQRHRDMQVLARAADGTEIPLPIRARRVDIDPTGALARVLEATAAAHRQLREDLLRATERLPADLADRQAALDARLETLTIWLTRMDERLAALAGPAAPPRRGADPWQVALGAVLAVVVVGAGVGTAMLLGLV